MHHNIILQDKPSFSEIIVYNIFWGLCGLGVMLVLAALIPVAILKVLFALMGFGLAALFGMRLIYDLLERQASSYTLSDQFLTVRRGLVSTSTKTIPVANIQDVRIYQNAIERITGCGTLFVKAPGFSIAPIKRVPDPNKWHDQILSSRQMYHKSKEKPLGIRTT